MSDYNEVTCVTAEELRSVGVPIPDDIPDVGWVPRSCMSVDVASVKAAEDGSFEVGTVVRFSCAFRWIAAEVAL